MRRGIEIKEPLSEREIKQLHRLLRRLRNHPPVSDSVGESEYSGGEQQMIGIVEGWVRSMAGDQGWLV